MAYMPTHLYRFMYPHTHCTGTCLHTFKCEYLHPSALTRQASRP